jgi:hypothetical protein
MFKPGQLKYPFGIRILEERLELERKWLIAYNKVGDGLYAKECSEKNISSCTHRIAELELAIKDMRAFVYTQEECDILNKTENE